MAAHPLHLAGEHPVDEQRHSCAEGRQAEQRHTELLEAAVAFKGGHAPRGADSPEVKPEGYEGHYGGHGGEPVGKP